VNSRDINLLFTLTRWSPAVIPHMRYIAIEPRRTCGYSQQHAQHRNADVSSLSFCDIVRILTQSRLGIHRIFDSAVPFWRWTCRRFVASLSLSLSLSYRFPSLSLSTETSLKYAPKNFGDPRYKSSRGSWPLDIYGSGISPRRALFSARDQPAKGRKRSIVGTDATDAAVVVTEANFCFSERNR